MVECLAQSVPSVQSVQWYFATEGADDLEGQAIVTSAGQHGGKYSVQENRSLDSVQSSLIIHSVEESDFRAYTCKVTNALGTDVATFTLEEQGNWTIFLLSILIISAKYFVCTYLNTCCR